MTLDHLPELLDAVKITRAMDDFSRSQLSQLIILDSVDSTNRYVLENSDARIGFVCLAEQQTQGRGRRGRAWVSPPGGNIYLSLLSSSVNSQSSLSIAVGVAVVHALEAYGLKNIGIKWPNDIVFQQQKLGGILLEKEISRLVIGVGINVSMAKQQEINIDQAWTDIETILKQKPDRNKVTALLLQHLFHALTQFQQKGFQTFIDAWNDLDVLAGQNVSVYSSQTTVSGIAKGIDHTGALLIETAAGLKKFHSGDVSVRIHDITN